MGKRGKFPRLCLCRKSDDTMVTVPSGCKICEYPSVLAGVFHAHVGSLFHLWFNSADIGELHQG